MANPRYLWLGMAALGLATGFAIPKKGEPETEVPATEGQSSPANVKRGNAGTGTPKATAHPAPLPASQDSVEDLLALDAPELYGRLGLWLLDASAEDMAAFWKAYNVRGSVNPWIKDLVFTQWAKKDIHGLLETAKRDKEEGPAWRAWTLSDPDAALAAMEGQSEEIRNWVFRGIDNFHPKRALKMLEEDPSLALYFNMSNLADELARNDPEAAMELLSKRSGYYLGTALAKWAKDDPYRAFDWLSERGADADLRKQFVNAVMQDHPEVLSDLAAGMPSGAAKREFQDAIFKKLTETDPVKALEEARKIEAPPLAAQRMAQVGKAMVHENPEQALEILRETLKVCPDASTRIKWTRYPNGGSGGGGGVPGVNEFIGELARWNPQLVMESVTESERANPEASSNSYQDRTATLQVANAWLAKDAEGYSAWVEQQDEANFNFGAATYSTHLANQDDFTGAVAWAQRIKDPSRQANALAESIPTWVARDREAATQWFDQTELPEQVRKRLGPYFQNRPK